MASILKPKKSKPVKKDTKQKKYMLRLYIVGKTPNCLSAIRNLKKICEDNFPNLYEIEIIDLMKLPQLAKDDQILAIPTVTRKLPKPMRKVIGDLSNAEQVLIGLDLQPKK